MQLPWHYQLPLRQTPSLAAEKKASCKFSGRVDLLDTSGTSCLRYCT